ncbi:MAG: DUF4398 domain-containing protein [Pseudomonadota bacterium]
MRRITLVALLGAVAALAAGCASTPPVQELSDARQAIMAAEDAGADRYATARLNAAQMLLSSAEEKLQEQDYRGARTDAVSAHSRAVEARVIARASLPENR